MLGIARLDCTWVHWVLRVNAHWRAYLRNHHAWHRHRHIACLGWRSHLHHHRLIVDGYLTLDLSWDHLKELTFGGVLI